MTDALLAGILVMLIAIWLAMPARTFTEQTYMRVAKALDRIADALDKPSERHANARQQHALHIVPD